MALNEYDRQRIQGAKAIVLTAKALAREKGIAPLECLWNSGRGIASREKHILEIRAQGKSSKGIFSDEQLADYPDRVGAEKMDCTLSEMVCNLIG